MESSEKGLLLVTDASGRIAYVSRSVENWSGFSVAEAIGAKPGDLWGGNMDQTFYQSLWKSIAVDQKPFTSRLANRAKSGLVLPSLLTVLPLIENGRAHYFLAIQPEPDAWTVYEHEFSRQWQRLTNDPVALSLWIERWTKKQIDVMPNETVLAWVERTLIRPISAQFIGREIDHDSVTLAQGDLQQYALLFERHYATVLGYLRRRLSDAAEAEDVAQDVFIKAMNGLSGYRIRNASYKTYLLRIAHNELLNRYRHSVVEQKWAAGHISHTESPIQILENRDALERALGSLGNIEQRILQAFYGEGRSVSEVAALVGKSENAVKLVLSRSRKRLRNEL